MFKSRVFKAFLVAFVLITAVGIMANLVGTLSGRNSTSSKETHNHDFEMISFKEGTCAEPGIKTFKCKGCDETTTEQVAGGHHYSIYDVCKNCGHSDSYETIVDRISVGDSIPSSIEFYNCSIDDFENASFLVIFNPGSSDETPLLVYGRRLFYYNYFYLGFYNNTLSLNTEYFEDYSELDWIECVSIYFLGTDLKIVEYEPYWFSNCFDIYVDGVLIDVFYDEGEFCIPVKDIITFVSKSDDVLYLSCSNFNHSWDEDVEIAFGESYSIEMEDIKYSVVIHN